MKRLGIFQGVVLFAYLFFQVIVLKNAVLFHVAFCFFYLAYLLSLPVDLSKPMLMLVGFGLGFMVDIFYDSQGLHAMACVFLGYIRNYWLGALTPQGGYDSNAVPSLAAFGTQWFVTYAAPLVFVHHLLLFYVEAGGFAYFWHTLAKVLASTAFTLAAILIGEFIFPGRRS
jgi:hypothetical protein